MNLKYVRYLTASELIYTAFVFCEKL